MEKQKKTINLQEITIKDQEVFINHLKQENKILEDRVNEITYTFWGILSVVALGVIIGK